MGYDKSKKWSDQTNQARENVSIVYNAMVQNAVSKPDMYGKFLTATLHVDEGTPHVDYDYWGRCRASNVVNAWSAER